MPLFQCSKCGCVENTAPSNYAVRERGSPALCSECDPEIGKWHGMFPKRSAKGMIKASDGFLYSQKDVLSDSFVWRVKNQSLKVEGVVEE